MEKYRDADIEELIGKTLISVYRTNLGTTRNGNDSLEFVCEDGRKFALTHIQNCCESVYLEDVCGDLSDLIGSPILRFDEVTNMAFEKEHEEDVKYCDSYTWTFYIIGTQKGTVSLRWFGESNGYYSEYADFIEWIS